MVSALKVENAARSPILAAAEVSKYFVITARTRGTAGLPCAALALGPPYGLGSRGRGAEELWKRGKDGGEMLR